MLSGYQTGRLARSIGYMVPRASKHRPGFMARIAPNEQNQIPDMAAFASSLSSTGFQKLPSGLIIQWGIVSGASNYTVTYPVTFPSRSLALLAVPHTTSVAGISAMGIANCSDITKSQFYIIVGGISQGEIVKYERSCFWVAIGV